MIQKKTANKSNIINNISSIYGIPIQIIDKITNDIINLLTESLIINTKLKISKFGTFKIKLKKKRKGRNPKTGEKFDILPRKTITFKISDSLNKLINNTSHE